MKLNCRFAALAAALALFASTAQASVTYQFSIDTSSIAGTDGFVEFQFSNWGGFGPVTTGTATVSGFQNSGGSFTEADPRGLTDLPPIPNVFGDQSGVLPGDLVLKGLGTGSVDDYLHGVVFGNAVSFQLTLDGAMVDGPLCSACTLPVFSLDFLKADGSGFLLTGDPDGLDFPDWLIAQVEVEPDGSTILSTPPGPGGSASLVSARLAAAAPVPEPASWMLLLTGFGALGFGFRRRA